MKSDKLKKANEYINDNFDKINTRFRQKYHFNVPIGWMNDPNGVCEYKGRIHVFYQFNPYSSKWDVMHWGHAVTDDFIVWQNHYVALAPDQKGVDDGQGCFSGSSVVEDGKICLIYTGVSDKQQVCMAYLKNGVLGGEYTHERLKLPKADSGHAMIFKDFSGVFRICLHENNSVPCGERAAIYRVGVNDGRLVVYDK